MAVNFIIPPMQKALPWDEVDGILTPKMTSDTTPTGNSCFASHKYAGYKAYMAFDQNTNYVNDFYHSTSTMPQYIGIQVEKKILPTSLEMYNGQGSSWTSRMPGTFTVQASNDGTNWVNMANIVQSGAYSYMKWNLNIPIKKENFYSYWRLYITKSCTSDNYMNIGAINFYGYRLK